MSQPDQPPSSIADRLRQHRLRASESFLEDNEKPSLEIRGPLYDASRPNYSSTWQRNVKDKTAVPTDAESSDHGPPLTVDSPTTPPATPGAPLPGDPPAATGSSNVHPEASSGLDYPTTQVKLIIDERDVDQQLAWQQQRLTGKAADESYRASKRLGELVQDNLDASLRLHAIRVVGAQNTRAGFLRTVLAPHILAVDHLSPSLHSILAASNKVQAQLRGLDIFSHIEPSLEASPSVLAGPEDVDLVLRVTEQGKYFIRTATDVGNGEGSATGTARIRNAFGGAELLEANVSFGTKTRSSIQFRGEAPVNGRPDRRLELTGFLAEQDLTHYASCNERLKGAILRFKANSTMGHHELAYEASVRQLCNFAPHASVSMRNMAGHTLKSSLSHTFTSDTRDDPFMATRGAYLRMAQEYAGLGGDAQFAKCEAETLVSRALSGNVTGALGARAGWLYPLSQRDSLFSDRFQLGGPTSVRMFRINSLGPKDNGDYLGGDMHWAVGVSLLAPIPRRSDWPLKLHGFINAGRLIAAQPGESVTGNLGKLFSQPSIAAGVGLVYRHSMVRVEVNLGVPLAAHASDGARKGLQFGLGLNFL